MTDQVTRICHLCQKETDHFEICENCDRVVCLKCLTTKSGVILRIDKKLRCPKCGSDRVAVYREGKRVIE